MSAVAELAPKIGTTAACDALALPRATYYRRMTPPEPAAEVAPRTSPRALSEAERQEMLDVLHSERFQDASVREVHATLLEEGIYMCAVRTMYRVLAEAGEVAERRAQRTHPTYAKPELLATSPNQVWSWDITKLRGPAKWQYFHLYVIIDIFSRLVVGWMVAERESATLADRLITETCDKQDITPGQLTIHADRGTSMTSKAVAQLLGDLGVTKTHSRPHTSNDNPYSESQFKTMKYAPSFPGSFGSLEDARGFCRGFFDWYNKRHHHGGIGYLTPEQVHYGDAERVQEVRATALAAAYAAHPERFVKGPPAPPSLPTAAWINPPAPHQAERAPTESRLGEGEGCGLLGGAAQGPQAAAAARVGSSDGEQVGPALHTTPTPSSMSPDLIAFVEAN